MLMLLVQLILSSEHFDFSAFMKMMILLLCLNPNSVQISSWLMFVWLMIDVAWWSLCHDIVCLCLKFVGCCCWLLVDYHAAHALLLLWNLFVFPAHLHGLCLGYLFDCCCMIIIVSLPFVWFQLVDEPWTWCINKLLFKPDHCHENPYVLCYMMLIVCCCCCQCHVVCCYCLNHKLARFPHELMASVVVVLWLYWRILLNAMLL